MEAPAGFKRKGWSLRSQTGCRNSIWETVFKSKAKPWQTLAGFKPQAEFLDQVLHQCLLIQLTLFFAKPPCSNACIRPSLKACPHGNSLAAWNSSQLSTTLLVPRDAVDVAQHALGWYMWKSLTVQRKQLRLKKPWQAKKTQSTPKTVLEHHRKDAERHWQCLEDHNQFDVWCSRHAIEPRTTQSHPVKISHV